MLSNQHASLLWHYEMGADELIEHEAVNRFNMPEPVETKEIAMPADTQPAAIKAPPLLNSALQDAQDAIADVETIADLQEAVMAFEGCALKATARNTVFAEGVEASDVMIIGEAPGADEDRQGVPFCGASGQLLDKMLASIGLSRHENCYITNTIFWRPPGNRTPTPEEMQICEPFVQKHIALFQPKLLILAGGTPAKHLLKTDMGVTRLRGKAHQWHDAIRGCDIPVRVLFHPSYLLRQPLHKRLAWQDLQEIRELLNN